jgi:mediator of RNA polymerase II transcription subunit 7
MEEDQDQSQPRLSAAFPAPPPFWKQFTSENLSKLEEIKNEQKPDVSPSKWTPAELRTLELPPELRFLIPPEPPSSGTYTCFGQELNVSIPSKFISESV